MPPNWVATCCSEKYKKYSRIDRHRQNVKLRKSKLQERVSPGSRQLQMNTVEPVQARFEKKKAQEQTEEAEAETDGPRRSKRVRVQINQNE